MACHGEGNRMTAILVISKWILPSLIGQILATRVTNCTLREIDNRNLQNKLNSADPVLTGIIRGLSLRIGDANALAEKYWQELSVYKSLEK